MEEKTRGYKLENSATDHLPIAAEVTRMEGKNMRNKVVVKGSMKNFTKENWNRSLAKGEWEKIGQTEDVNVMAEVLNEQITIALDECAPIKEFQIRRNHRFGLKEETRKMMKERDSLRKKIGKSDEIRRKEFQEEYRKIRNAVTNKVRQDTIEINEERIEKAGDENELWKIVNDITNPKAEASWKLEEEGRMIENEKEIADIFNDYFIEKIENLKRNINKEYVKDPLEKLKRKMERKNLKFKLKTVTEKKVKKAMLSLKKKKSAGKDGISQEQIVLGTDVLVIPLTRIINNSISTGVVPEAWKEAIVTPILKKGDPKKKENYRPVSCLAVASKVMERIVCYQVTRFFEVHGLLPDNQHGFRAKRSTMTALAAMQEDWVGGDSKVYGIKRVSSKPIQNNTNADECKARRTLQSQSGRQQHRRRTHGDTPRSSSR